MSLIALAENLDREDLSDYETGIALGKMMELFKNKEEIAEYFKRTKKDIHRLLAFNSFPSWLKDRLNINPQLISKTISQSLKAIFENSGYDDEKHSIYVIKALNQMEEGELTQSVFIDHIKQQIANSDNTKSRPRNIISKCYKHGGKEVGKFMYDEKKLSIKLNASVIDSTMAEEIFHLIDQKIISMESSLTE